MKEEGGRRKVTSATFRGVVEGAGHRLGVRSQQGSNAIANKTGDQKGNT